MQHTPLIITQPTLPNMQSLGSRPPQRERVLQSLLTVVVMGLALLLLKWLNLTTVASLAGTACNLFASPHVKVSRPRNVVFGYTCLLYTSPSPRDRQKSRMPSSA